MKRKSMDSGRKASLDKVLEREWKYNDYEYPRVSIIVPTYNCAEKISLTLDGIFNQQYPDFEIIIIDATSTDRTLEVVKNYKDDRMHIYSVTAYQRYEMINKGISQATGEYMNILFPGDYYIYRQSTHSMMEQSIDGHKPDLIYCGTLLRDGKQDPKILFRKLSLSLLKRGQQPTSLQSCWFKIETVRKLGKFSINYEMRGGYELMCRFSLKPELRFISVNRVFTDYDLRFVTRRMVTIHFFETLKTIRKYFGLYFTARWLFTQKDFSRLLKIWVRTIRTAFIGR